MSSAEERGLWEQTAQGQLSASFTPVSCTPLEISLGFLICIMGITMGLRMKIQELICKIFRTVFHTIHTRYKYYMHNQINHSWLGCSFFLGPVPWDSAWPKHIWIPLSFFFSLSQITLGLPLQNPSAVFRIAQVCKGQKRQSRDFQVGSWVHTFNYILWVVFELELSLYV